jgi:hypothetical protein
VAAVTDAEAEAARRPQLTALAVALAGFFGLFAAGTPAHAAEAVTDTASCSTSYLPLPDPRSC